MQGLTVEFQRFGDPTGVIRLSDCYIRTVGSTSPTEEVSFGIAQENLDAGMGSLAYEKFGQANAESVRRTAKHFLDDITPHLERFVLADNQPLDCEGRCQLDIVTRALELSQLPFEILEESHPQLVVTRRIRQHWPPPEVVRSNVPKVLFAWAEPKQRLTSRRGMEVPHERHRELLTSLLADWGPSAVVEVKNATRQKLADALTADHCFTHVHLLAHGVPPVTHPIPEGDRIDLNKKLPPSTLLALEAEDGTFDRCLPSDLAAIFERVPRPESLALATCHSGDVDSVRSSATLAHVLHAAGIPVVLASQLALTKDGSDELIRTFLSQVIEGADPRDALRDCRDKLRENEDKTYFDRVALVGYVHVDDGLAERLKQRQFKVALKRLKVISKDARDRVEQAVVDLEAAKVLTDQQRADAEAIRSRFNSVRQRLARLEPDRTLTKKQREELLGLQASSLKREAEEAWRLSTVLPGDASKPWADHSHQMLRDAAIAYGRAAEISRDHHWTWVQWLVLDAVQRGALTDREEDWIVAKAAAQDAARRKLSAEATEQGRIENAEDIAWASGSLCELNLLAPLVGRGDQLAEAKSCLDNLMKAAGQCQDNFPITSTLDQLARYADWWGADSRCNLPAGVIAQARKLYDYLEAANKAQSGVQTC